MEKKDYFLFKENVTWDFFKIFYFVSILKYGSSLNKDVFGGVYKVYDDSSYREFLLFVIF